MPEYRSKKDAEQKLKTARIKYAEAREKRKKDATAANIAAEKRAQKDCIDIQHVLDRWF